MSIEINASVEGLEKVIQKLSDPQVAKHASKRMDRALLHIEAGAKMHAPNFMGGVASSITHEVNLLGGDVQGVVGSPLKVAAYQEFGTGLLSDAPNAPRRRHWPPADALDVWARRVAGKTGREIAFFIGRRGGLKPKRFLRNSFDENFERVKSELASILDDVANFMAGR